MIVWQKEIRVGIKEVYLYLHTHTYPPLLRRRKNTLITISSILIYLYLIVVVCLFFRYLLTTFLVSSAELFEGNSPFRFSINSG